MSQNEIATLIKQNEDLLITVDKLSVQNGKLIAEIQYYKDCLFDIQTSASRQAFTLNNIANSLDSIRRGTYVPN